LPSVFVISQKKVVVYGSKTFMHEIVRDIIYTSKMPHTRTITDKCIGTITVSAIDNTNANYKAGRRTACLTLNVKLTDNILRLICSTADNRLVTSMKCY